MWSRFVCRLQILLMTIVRPYFLLHLLLLFFFRRRYSILSKMSFYGRFSSLASKYAYVTRSLQTNPVRVKASDTTECGAMHIKYNSLQTNEKRINMTKTSPFFHSFVHFAKMFQFTYRPCCYVPYSINIGICTGAKSRTYLTFFS